MRRKKIYKTLSPPVDYWSLSSLLLMFFLICFSFLLIRERLFLEEMNVYLNKHKIDINSFNHLSLNSHLSLIKPTNPLTTSTVDIIYLQPPKYSYQNKLYQNEF
ncbi:MAG: hypothetical protein KatS3mg095_0672 [Candidatus Parcubacteria bacterium]|nr:MAG: hypothetical protein KatS3mg095_0672 [Candidatus Parcubacteria bacterium]